MKDPAYKVELKALEQEVKQKVYGDLQIFYDQLRVSLQNAGDLNNLKFMHRVLARFGSKKVKKPTNCQPLPALRRGDGTLACSFTEQQMIWMKQFSASEAGTQLHWQDLQRSDRPGLATLYSALCPYHKSSCALQRAFGLEGRPSGAFIQGQT